MLLARVWAGHQEPLELGVCVCVCAGRHDLLDEAAEASPLPEDGIRDTPKLAAAKAARKKKPTPRRTSLSPFSHAFVLAQRAHQDHQGRLGAAPSGKRLDAYSGRLGAAPLGKHLGATPNKYQTAKELNPDSILVDPAQIQNAAQHFRPEERIKTRVISRHIYCGNIQQYLGRNAKGRALHTPDPARVPQEYGQE